MSNQYQPEITLALEDVLGSAPENISDNTSLQNDINLDSMSFVLFLIALEDRLPGFSFDDDLLGFETFETVGTLRKSIAAHLAN